MTSKRLRKIKLALEAMEASPRGLRSRDLSGLAKKLGRNLFGGGNHPNYVRSEPPKFMPLSIPNHSGDIPIGTACIIIEHLLNDCDEWELWLIENESKESDDSN
jgi:hypothetical protein